MTRKLCSFLALALFVLLGVGCCPKMTQLDISIDADEAFRKAYPNKQITVDLVAAVGPSEQERLKTYSMTKYWQAGDTMRKSLKTVSLTIDTAKKEPLKIAASDPIWAEWQARSNNDTAPQIFVLVQLPGAWDISMDRDGPADKRRQILSTNKCDWVKIDKTLPMIELTINPDRLITVTPMRPE